MNKKNLMDAFGDINEEMFAKAEEGNSQYCEECEPLSPVFVFAKEKERNKKPLFALSAAAGILAAAICVPMIIKSGGGLVDLSTPSASDTSQVGTSSENNAAETISSEGETPSNTQTAPVNEETIHTDIFTHQDNLFNAEDLYRIEKKEINVNKLDQYGEIKSIILSQLYGDLTYLDGNSLYYSSISFSEEELQKKSVNKDSERMARLYRYDLDTEENVIVFEEQSELQQFGLILKIAGVDGDWIYYHHFEVDLGSLKCRAKLLRFNLLNGSKEEILDMGFISYYGPVFSGVNPFIKSGKNLYFCYESIYYPNTDCYIYCYDTEKEKLELLCEHPTINETTPYKNGVAYSLGGDKYYYIENDGGGEQLLVDNIVIIEPKPRYNNVCTGIYSFAEGKIAYVCNFRDIDNTFGFLDENLEKHDLITTDAAIFPCDFDVKSGLTMLGLSSSHNPLIYDYEQECFSELKLPEKTKTNTSIYSGTQWININGNTDNIKFMTFESDPNDETKFTSLTLYTISPIDN